MKDYFDSLITKDDVIELVKLRILQSLASTTPEQARGCLCLTERIANGSIPARLHLSRGKTVDLRPGSGRHELKSRESVRRRARQPIVAQYWPVFPKSESLSPVIC